MIYPADLKGPQFSSSPLVELTFKGAKITLPVPEVPQTNPLYKDAPIRDFINCDTSYWEPDGLGNVFENIISQRWVFEDIFNRGEINSCQFEVNITEVNIEHQQNNLILNKATFKKHIIDGFAYALIEHENEHLDFPDWPKAHNEFNYECISKPDLDWLQMQRCFVEGQNTVPFAFIPLDNRFALDVSIDMYPLHHHLMIKPYSEELFRKLQFDLFAEYIQSIELRYTEETLKIIREVNK
jgi:hypothetical protein